MKKVYSAPELSIVNIEAISMFASSPGEANELGTYPRSNGTGGVSGGFAKDRDDEEYYEPEGGDYGNLW